MAFEHKERQQFIVRSTILDRERQVVIDPEYFEFDDKDRIADVPTRFLRMDIQGLRYGVKVIRGYQFRIGRIYCIDVRDVSGRVVKIRLQSLYRIRLKLLNEKYLAITNALYRQYFHQIIREHFAQFQNGAPVELLGVNLNSDGVLFDEKVGRVSWLFIGTKRYWHNYRLYSEESPDMYRTFVFLEDWNTGVLQGLIGMILKEKFPKWE